MNMANGNTPNESKLFKHSIYNNNIITTKSPGNAVDICNRFITCYIGYKPHSNFILEVNDDELRCPIIPLFKAIVLTNCHSFSLNPRIKDLIDKSKAYKELYNNNGVALEQWEENWIRIFECLYNEEYVKLGETLIKNGKECPNDLVGFKFGMVYGLQTGDKKHFREIADLFYSHEKNREDPYFIGIYAFILEELQNFDESEKWVLKGLEIEPNAIWTQHVYAHILYETNRIEQSIQYLEEKKPTWKANASHFIHKHINWHLSVSYLEEENYAKGAEIIDEIIHLPFDDAECPLAFLGYVLRVFIRTEHLQPNVKPEWVTMLIEYLKRLNIYTGHLLFDIMAVWLLSYTNEHDDKFRKMNGNLIYAVIQKINDNVNSIKHEGTKFYLQNNYLPLLDAGILFGKFEFEKCLNILKEKEEACHHLGASDEQLFVLFEIALFCAYKCKDIPTFKSIVDRNFGELRNLKFVQKWIKELGL
jgi:tetratricopeptide (TPR) repeat protein